MPCFVECVWPSVAKTCGTCPCFHVATANLLYIVKQVPLTSYYAQNWPPGRAAISFLEPETSQRQPQQKQCRQPDSGEDRQQHVRPMPVLSSVTFHHHGYFSRMRWLNATIATTIKIPNSAATIATMRPIQPRRGGSDVMAWSLMATEAERNELREARAAHGDESARLSVL